MLRLLPTLEADGPTQMATDEALLEAAVATTLRLYRWRPATVSLGYFQAWEGIAPRLPPGPAGPLPVVRRITGGGAIWHDHEVTYALVGELGRDGLPERVRDVYPLLHGAVMAELSRRGASVDRQEADAGDRRYREEPRCFASPAADDLVSAAGGKVLGSAARVRERRILVHGSLKLASNPWDGVAVAACGLPWDEAAAALVTGIATALGLGTTDGQMTAGECAAQKRIHAERYGNDDWVQRRLGPRA
ncbi:MAG: lipoate--protein ligase family protein [Planctomycetes bacterium]|nr:lipoate--protein ligase family protein [Planctomycetota bacterium]